MDNKEHMEAISSSAIGKATVWSFAAEFSAKIIVPVTNIILARIISPESFGIIATINMVVSFADTFSQAGFQKYLVQHEFDGKKSFFDSANVAFWTNFSISVFAWIIILLFNEPFAAFVGNPGYGFPLIISALSLPLTSFSCIQEAIFQRQLNFRVLFYRRIIVSLVPFFITIPLALLGLKHWALILGTLSGELVKAVMLTVASEWKPRFFFKTKQFREMFSFCLWTLLESIAMWFSSYIDIVIVSNSLGAYYTGLYKNSQSTVTSILAIITGATTTVLFSALSRVQNDRKRFEDIFYSFQKNVAILVLPMGVGLFFFSDFITRILLGNSWMEASKFVGIWGLCTSLVCVFGTFSREVYRAKGHPKISLLAQFLHLIFVIPVCIFSVNKGFDFLIYARSFSYLQIIVVHMVFLKLFFDMSPLKMVNSVKEPILCSIIMGVIAYFFLKSRAKSMLLQFVAIIICMIVYFGTMSIFKENRELFKKLLKQIIKTDLRK